MFGSRYTARLLREFLDEAYSVTLARIDRRLEGVDGPVARLESVVGTLVWTHLHDDFAQQASVVTIRAYTRLGAPERAAIEVQRKALLDVVVKFFRQLLSVFCVANDLRFND